MQFALQALPFPRHSQNDGLFAHLPATTDSLHRLPHSACGAVGSAIASHVRILRDEASAQGGRVLISGRMADVCAALNRLAVNEFAHR